MDSPFGEILFFSSKSVGWLWLKLWLKMSTKRFLLALACDASLLGREEVEKSSRADEPYQTLSNSNVLVVLYVLWITLLLPVCFSASIACRYCGLIYQRRNIWDFFDQGVLGRRAGQTSEGSFSAVSAQGRQAGEAGGPRPTPRYLRVSRPVGP